MNNVLLKMGVACTASLALTETLNLDVLWNALITLAVSIVSVLAVEGVAWLKNQIIKHTPKVDEEKESEKNSEKEE